MSSVFEFNSEFLFLTRQFEVDNLVLKRLPNFNIKLTNILCQEIGIFRMKTKQELPNYLLHITQIISSGKERR